MIELSLHILECSQHLARLVRVSGRLAIQQALFLLLLDNSCFLVFNYLVIFGRYPADQLGRIVFVDHVFETSQVFFVLAGEEGQELDVFPEVVVVLDVLSEVVADLHEVGLLLLADHAVGG